MKEITRSKTTNSNQSATAKLGGLVCNKNAPIIKSAKAGESVRNKNTHSAREA